MKNSKGETLPQPYLDLARMRRAQNPYDNALLGFSWNATDEGRSFWYDVWLGGTPAIPAASLAELEEWRKAKGIHEAPAEPDYKAMYYELKTANDALLIEYKDLEAKYDKLKATNPDRNWVAECAMAVAVGFAHGAYLPNDEEIVKCAWELAEAWAAEGKKRGHIN